MLGRRNDFGIAWGTWLRTIVGVDKYYVWECACACVEKCTVMSYLQNMVDSSYLALIDFIVYVKSATKLFLFECTFDGVHYDSIRIRLFGILFLENYICYTRREEYLTGKLFLFNINLVVGIASAECC